MSLQDLGALADQWQLVMGRALLEGTVVLLVVAAVWWPLRRRAPAQLGYGLFLLVPLKLLLPFQIALPPAAAALFPAHYCSGQATPVGDATSLSTLADTLERAPEPVAGAPAWLLLAYALVVVCLTVRCAHAQWQTARLVHRARPLHPGELAVELDELQRRARVRPAVRWLVSEHIDTPAAGGLFRPYVLLPAGLIHKLAPEPLAWVLLHELAHIRRRDIPVALLQRIAQIVFFFHPALWLANRVVGEQREFACDAEALAASGVRRAACGEGFLSVVAWASGHNVLPATTLAMFDPKSVMHRRLIHMMKHREQSKLAKVLSGTVIATAALVLLPSVKADTDLEPLLAETTQDPEQIRALQRKLAALERAHAELERELESARRGSETDAPDKSESEDHAVVIEVDEGEDEADDEDEDEHEAEDEDSGSNDGTLRNRVLRTLRDRVLRVKPGTSQAPVLLDTTKPRIYHLDTKDGKLRLPTIIKDGNAIVLDAGQAVQIDDLKGQLGKLRGKLQLQPTYRIQDLKSLAPLAVKLRRLHGPDVQLMPSNKKGTLQWKAAEGDDEAAPENVGDDDRAPRKVIVKRKSNRLL